MALDKLVDSAQLDSDLTSVANAIRTKGGTSASLAFPQGFVDAVGAIQAGGGLDYVVQTVTRTSNTQTVNVDREFNNFLFVAFKPVDKRVRLSDIPVKNRAVSQTQTQNMFVPR